MNIQPDAMTGPVEVALHPTIDQSGLIPGLFKPVADPLMDLHSVGTVLDLRDGFFLRIFHGLIEPLEFRAGGTADHRAGHIGKIPAVGRSREDIENNAAVRGQRARAFMVRVAGLFAAGHNRMLRHAIALHQLDVDELLDAFRGQYLPVQPEFPAADRRLLECRMGRRHRFFRRALRRFDAPHLFGGFHHAPLIKRIALRLHAVAQLLKPRGMDKRKIRRDQQLPDFGFPENHMNDIDRARFLGAVRLRFLFQLGIRQDPIHRRLRLGPIHFEIAHDQQPLALDLHIDEGVRRDKPRRIIEIRIEFAGGNKEGRDVRLCGNSSFHG